MGMVLTGRLPQAFQHQMVINVRFTPLYPVHSFSQGVDFYCVENQWFMISMILQPSTFPINNGCGHSFFSIILQPKSNKNITNQKKYENN